MNTKSKMDDAFGLPPITEAIDQLHNGTLPDDIKNDLKEVGIDTEITIEDNQLPIMEQPTELGVPLLDDALNESDVKLRTVHEEAMKSYTNLMDLGMAVEPKFSGDVLHAALGMLKIGMESAEKQAGLKIKSVTSAANLAQARAASEIKADIHNSDPVVIVEDRNTILRKMKSGDL